MASKLAGSSTIRRRWLQSSKLAGSSTIRRKWLKSLLVLQQSEEDGFKAFNWLTIVPIPLRTGCIKKYNDRNIHTDEIEGENYNMVHKLKTRNLQDVHKYVQYKIWRRE